MALIKVSEVDKYEVVGEFKHVQCRTATWVEEDGVIVGSKNFHRHVISCLLYTSPSPRDS